MPTARPLRREEIHARLRSRRLGGRTPTAVDMLALQRCAPPILCSDGLRFGTKEYWEKQYSGADDFIPASEFSWYSGWEEIAPFFEELVPDNSAQILLPGVGNDKAMVGLYDAGYTNLYAFDYAPASVERSRELFGEREVDLRVADAKELPFDDAAFDATLEKGTLDSVFLSGEDDADKRKQLQRAVDELARTVRPGGVVISITGFQDKIAAAFADEQCWDCLRDGSVHITEDGVASNQINAYFLAWRRLRGGSTRTLASSRNRVRLLAAIAAVPFTRTALPCHAAIPSMSEYAAEQYRYGSRPAPPSTSSEPPPLTTRPVEELAPAEGLLLVRSGLKRAAALVDSGNLEAVRKLLREPLFSGFLGFTPGVRGNAGNLKPPAALLAAGCDKAALEELLLSLKRLDDFCLSNRVIIFNQEDLDQVKALMESTGKDGSVSGRIDYTEARMFLADAGEVLDEAVKTLRQ